MRSFSSGQGPIAALPPRVQRTLMFSLLFCDVGERKQQFLTEVSVILNLSFHVGLRSFCYMYMYMCRIPTDPLLITMYLFDSQLLQPFHERFMSLVHRDDFQSVCHDTTVQQTILGILDAMCGLVEARRPEHFEFLLPFLQVCVSLMEVYAGVSEVIAVILQLFSLVTEYSVIWRESNSVSVVHNIVTNS